jgi:nitrogenase molybdenum-iron protein alpha/beta subunit
VPPDKDRKDPDDEKQNEEIEDEEDEDPHIRRDADAEELADEIQRLGPDAGTTDDGHAVGDTGKPKSNKSKRSMFNLVPGVRKK